MERGTSALQWSQHMSVFGKIFDKIFHRNQAGSGPTASATAGQPAGTLASAPTAAPGAAEAAAAGVAAQQVDVEAVLNGMAAKNSQKLNWRTSIVDLMKLLGLDSSLADRKELAKELNYAGDTNDSATMNIWLHKQVMIKLAANGGKVPADLM
jgi:hypothetical protein